MKNLSGKNFQLGSYGWFYQDRGGLSVYADTKRETIQVGTINIRSIISYLRRAGYTVKKEATK